MKLDTEFCKLPLRFDVERLAAEVAVFSEADWRAHPSDYKGSTALILISSNGGFNNTFFGPMLPTPLLERCPYLQQVLASFNTVFGRSRLMRLGGKSQVPEHNDIRYHWYHRVRIHVPIITNPSVRFHCNGRDVHMAAGEAWIFDSWKKHKVVNASDQTRVHLVADTTGTAEFWNLVARSERPFDQANSVSSEPRFIPYQPGQQVELPMEKFTHSVIMPPGEIDAIITDLVTDVRRSEGADADARDVFIGAAEKLRQDWRSTWTLYGAGRAGWGRYKDLLLEAHQRISGINAPLPVHSNGVSAIALLKNLVLASALMPEVATAAENEGSASPGVPPEESGGEILKSRA